MVKSIALDTSVAIKILNEDSKIIKEVDKYSHLLIPVIVKGELLFGAMNSGNSHKNLKIFNNFLNACTILNIDSIVAEEYAAIRKQLKLDGKPIPENDIWIAALCKVYNTGLLTSDKHFGYIKHIQVSFIK